MAAHRLTEAQRQEAVRLYESGLNASQVAKVYGVCPRGMRRTLKKRTTLRDERSGEKNPLYRGGKKAFKAAHCKIRRAVKSGKILKPETCSECKGFGRIEAHHDDYNKPLDIRWLCKKCHYEWHKVNEPIPYKGAA